MPLMRDKSTGVVREVSEQYLKRWPDDYESVRAGSHKKKSDDVSDEPEE